MSRRLKALVVCPLALSLLSAGVAFGVDPPRNPERELAGDATSGDLASDPLGAEFSDLMARLRAARDRRWELLELARQSQGERRRIFSEQASQRQREALGLLAALADNLTRQREEGRAVSDAVEQMAQRLEETWPNFRAQLDQLNADAQQIIDSLETASGEERLSLEKQRLEHARRLANEFQLLVGVILASEQIGVDVSTQRAYATERIEFFGEYLSTALALTTEHLAHLRDRVAESPDDAEVALALNAAEAQLDREVQSLSLVTTMLDDLGLETATYRQLLFEATGDITTDVLDQEVALGLLETWRARVSEAVMTNGSRWVMKVLVFLLILGTFRALASLVGRVVRRSVSSDRVRISQLLRDTLVSWSSRIVMAIGVLVALGQLGVAIGPLLAGLGIAGFVLGFALQDTLGNFAAGAMILMYRPYDVGDLIEAAGVRGKVSRMSLVSTTILTIDNQTLIVPNNKIWGDVIVNVTAQRIRRIDMVFGVSYSADVDQVDAVIRDILAKDAKVLDHPEPIVEVHNLGESSVDFAVRPWVQTEDYWPAYWSLHRQIKKRLDAEGIAIPFPQRDVHVRVVKADSG